MASSVFPPEPLAAIAEEVSDLLKEKGETVAVAETVCFRLYFSDYASKPNLSISFKMQSN
jgi:hypothetical protein